MVREICRDEAFLAQRAEMATPADLPVADDLLETLLAHRDGCVGMAANMIGVNKRIIAFENGGTYLVLLNPEIVKRSGPYEAEEGCLSLPGTRRAKRWQSIKVRYETRDFQPRYKTFTGFPAQIIQHELDHCQGILI
jgi:peptide deformylase